MRQRVFVSHFCDDASVISRLLVQTNSQHVRMCQPGVLEVFSKQILGKDRRECQDRVSKGPHSAGPGGCLDFQAMTKQTSPAGPPHLGPETSRIDQTKSARPPVDSIIAQANDT